MAIDRSVGGMKQYLFNLTTSNRYNKLRFQLSQLLFKLGLLNDERRKALIRFGNSLKSMAAQQQNVFEGMNIRYFGPIDGHDVKKLVRVLNDIKDMKDPRFFTCTPRKEKGFGPAEEARHRMARPRQVQPRDRRTSDCQYRRDASLFRRCSATRWWNWLKPIPALSASLRPCPAAAR